MRCPVGVVVKDLSSRVIVQQSPVTPHRDRVATALGKPDVVQGTLMEIELAYKSVLRPKGFRGRRQEMAPRVAVQRRGVELVQQARNQLGTVLRHRNTTSKTGAKFTKISSNFNAGSLLCYQPLRSPDTWSGHPIREQCSQMAATATSRDCPIRWGNRPAILWIAEDFGCCASG